MISILSRQRVLALVPGTRTVALAAGGGANGGRRIQCRTFAFPEGVGWDRPEELGQALRAFLQEQGLRLRGADVVALPAAWVALRTVSFPPTEELSLLPGMVEIAADELFAERLEELAYGYAAANGRGGLDVSIAACHKTRLDQLQALCAAAGLVMGSVLPLSMGVAAALDLPPGDNVLVLQHGHEAEVAVVCDGRVMWLRPLAGGAMGGEELLAELKRAALAAPAGAERRLYVLGEPALARAAGEAFGLPVSKPPAADVEPDMPNGCLAALAADARHAKAATLNLLSAQGRKPLRSWRPLLRKAALAVAAAACLLAWVGLRWRDARSQAQAADARLQAMASDARQVRRLQMLVETTDPWHRPNPGYLDALRALARQFPEEGSIWLTSLEMEASGLMTLTGKALGRGDVLELLGRLQACGSFDRVEPHFVRQQVGRERTVSFAVTCRYAKGPQT